MSQDAPSTTVLCMTHGNNRPWYMICLHVVEEGAPVAIFEEATILESGTCLCAKCFKAEALETLDVDHVRPICDLCFDKNIKPHATFMPGSGYHPSPVA